VNAAEQANGQRRWPWVVDLVLMATAIFAASWVGVNAPVANRLYSACELSADDQSTASDMTIYVDDTNRIYLGSTLIQSDAELAAQLTDSPGRVLLLVHPDGLFENVMRTVEVLRRAGAESIQLGTTRRSA
jgi:biopolymer transport protein ExbD